MNIFIIVLSGVSLLISLYTLYKIIIINKLLKKLNNPSFKTLEEFDK
jgi:hypothetical protein